MSPKTMQMERDSINPELHDLKLQLANQTQDAEKWFNKVKRIHTVIHSNNIRTSPSPSKPEGIFGGVSGLFGCTGPSNADFILMEIIKIIDES